jgi:hypothetical protein
MLFFRHGTSQRDNQRHARGIEEEATDKDIRSGRWETMARVFSFTAKAGVVIAACFLAASLVSVARAQNKTQLTGHWNFNQDQSDDAQIKVQDAQQNSKINANTGAGGNYPGGGGGYPGGGGGYPGGGGGGYPGGGGGYPGGGGMGGIGGRGGMGGGGMGRGGRQATQNGSSVSQEQWDRLAENPKYLRIDQRSDQIVVIDDADRAHTFYPDGKKHDDKDAGGNKISTKASWEGGAFIAETKMPHSQKLTETFRVSDDGKLLYVTSRFEASSLAGPLSIRRVYDVTKSSQPSK